MAKLYTTPYHHTSWSPPWAYSCIYTHAEDSCAVVYEVIITPAQLLILLHKPLQPYHDFLQGERRRIQIGWQCRRRIIKFWIWMGEFCICNKPGARRTRYPPTPSSRQSPRRHRWICCRAKIFHPASQVNVGRCLMARGRVDDPRWKIIFPALIMLL